MGSTSMTPTQVGQDGEDWTVTYEFVAQGTSWRVARLTLDERMGAPIIGTVRLVGDAQDDPSTLLGASASLVMRQGEFERVVTGIVTRLEPLGRHSGLPHARVVIESRIGLARRSKRWRIFQEMTAPAIAREVLGRLAGVEVEEHLKRPRAPRDYCVQHGEDDLSFVCRVLEDDGIAWRVEARGEAEAMEAMVLVDSTDAFVALEPSTAVEAVGGPVGTRAPGLLGMMFSLRLSSPGVVQRDWDWPTNPPCVREVTVSPDADLPAGLSEWVGVLETFPGRRHGADGASDFAHDEYVALASRDRVARCDSDLLGVSPGRFFEVELGDGQHQRMLVLGVRHLGSIPAVDPVAHARGGGDAPQDPVYVNAFECVPMDGDYRPERLSERPKIHGLQTAVVVGPPKEEIHTDEHGRIRVRMHWDRATTPDVDASCWLRVAQSWAGQGWGSSVIPRVGMEVLVAFLDGDPDRPICVGCVYNGAHRPPYTLPDEKTKSTFRSSSTPGGEGYNELTFDDAVGAEQVYVRAQRDLTTHVLRNECRSIGADQSIHVGHDQTVTIDGDQHVALKGNQTIAIDGGGTEGLPGSAVAVKGEVEVKVTEPGRIVIDAAESIELRVGATRILIDEASIRMLAGGGAIAHMNETLVLLAQGGAMARLGSSVDLRSAAGAQVRLDKTSASMQSPTGAQVSLDDTATLASSLAGEELKLAGGATLKASRILFEAAAGASMQLDADAAIEGGQVRSVSANGSLSLTSGGAKLDGTTVDIAAATMATMIAAMVKIN